MPQDEKILQTRESQLATVIIGVLLVIAGFLIYDYFRPSPLVEEEIAVTPTLEIREEQAGEELGEESEVYTVVEGDNLWKIAEKVYDDGFRWKDIARANNIPEERPMVEVGQKLQIPSIEELAEDVGGEEVLYTVQAGDTLWGIAQEKLGDASKWTELAKVNDISTEKPELEVGQQLVVSGFGGPEARSGDVLSALTAEKKEDDEVEAVERYTVVRGDTLWDIAQKFYGDGAKWRLIFEAPENNLSMCTPSAGQAYPLIHAGNVLVIPR